MSLAPELTESRCIPALVPNLRREAFCQCGHLVQAHQRLIRHWQPDNPESAPSFHRGRCSGEGCRCRYWVTGGFRVMQ